jgi:hypothetical protein
MRYELSDNEWSIIRPMLPTKPRGVPRVDDRRILNGIFWVLRAGAPWRDLPGVYGPRTTCYNRFVRWRRATMPIGSGHLSTSKERGPTSRRSAIADSLSASVPTSIVRAIASRSSSTRSSIAGASQLATTNSRPTIWPSYSWPQSGSGCAFMSSRPRENFPRKWGNAILQMR